MADIAVSVTTIHLITKPHGRHVMMLTEAFSHFFNTQALYSAAHHAHVSASRTHAFTYSRIHSLTNSHTHAVTRSRSRYGTAQVHAHHIDEKQQNFETSLSKTLQNFQSSGVFAWETPVARAQELLVACAAALRTLADEARVVENLRTLTTSGSHGAGRTLTTSGSHGAGRTLTTAQHKEHPLAVPHGAARRFSSSATTTSSRLHVQRASTVRQGACHQLSDLEEGKRCVEGLNGVLELRAAAETELDAWMSKRWVEIDLPELVRTNISFGHIIE